MGDKSTPECHQSPSQSFRSPTQSPNNDPILCIPCMSPLKQLPLFTSPKFSPRQSFAIHKRRSSESGLPRPLPLSPPHKRVSKISSTATLRQRLFFDSSKQEETEQEPLIPTPPSSSELPSPTSLLRESPTLLVTAPTSCDLSLAASEPPTTLELPDYQCETSLESLDQFCIFHNDSFYQFSYSSNPDSNLSLSITTTDPHSILSSIWSFSSFRSPQWETIESVLYTKSSLLLLPTGYGKTLPLQFFALCNRLNGPVIVISPLNALINDQLLSLPPPLRGYGVKSSDLGGITEKVVSNLVCADVIWISPEKAASPSFRKIWVEVSKRKARIIKTLRDSVKNLIDFELPKLNSFQMASLLVVDEAHCVTTWSHNFRSDFLRIPDFCAFLGNPHVLALSATCSFYTKQELIKNFNISSDCIFQISLPSNLVISASYNDNDSNNSLIKLLTSQDFKGPTLIFVSFHQHALSLKEDLVGATNLSVAAYHSGFTHKDKARIEVLFKAGKIDVLVATSAFGMGIDTSHVLHVIHYTIPRSPEDLLQQIGRAGRSRDDVIVNRSHVFLSDDDVRQLVSLVFSDMVGVNCIGRVLSFLEDSGVVKDSQSNLIEVMIDLKMFEKFCFVPNEVASTIVVFLEQMGFLTPLGLCAHTVIITTSGQNDTSSSVEKTREELTEDEVKILDNIPKFGELIKPNKRKIKVIDLCKGTNTFITQCLNSLSSLHQKSLISVHKRSSEKLYLFSLNGVARESVISDVCNELNLSRLRNIRGLTRVYQILKIFSFSSAEKISEAQFSRISELSVKIHENLSNYLEEEPLIEEDLSIFSSILPLRPVNANIKEAIKNFVIKSNIFNFKNKYDYFQKQKLNPFLPPEKGAISIAKIMHGLSSGLVSKHLHSKSTQSNLWGKYIDYPFSELLRLAREVLDEGVTSRMSELEHEARVRMQKIQMEEEKTKKNQNKGNAKAIDPFRFNQEID
ncbi:hypothetical protein P9112_003850 [Eukaryota sp. TZLM1-RC]